MGNPIKEARQKQDFLRPQVTTGKVLKVDEAKFTCSVEYPDSKGLRQPDHGVSLKVSGTDAFGVYVIPAVGSRVRILREGKGKYTLLNCDSPAKLILWSLGAGGPGFKTVIDFQKGEAQVNDGEYHLPRYEKLLEKFNAHTHSNAAGTTTPPTPALDKSVKSPHLKVD